MKLIEKITYSEQQLQTDALDEAAESYDLIKDKLHAAITLDSASVKALEAKHTRAYLLKYFAMVLAAEHRDSDAFPLIIDYFSTHDEDAWNCLGSIMTRDMGRILASVSHDNINALKAAVESPALDTFVRVACFDALGALMREGAITRKCLVRCFRTWLQNNHLTQFERTALTNTSTSLALQEMKPDLLAALDAERIDTQKFNQEQIEYDLQNSEIDDAIISSFLLINDAAGFVEACHARSYLLLLTSMYEPEEMQALLRLCKGDNTANEIFSLEYLHGFMFAIVITPDLILPSEWQPLLFPDGMMALEPAQDMEAVTLGLMAFYNRLNNERMDESLGCPFDMVEVIDMSFIPMAQDWCTGFVLALALRQQFWVEHQMEGDFKEAMGIIMTLSDEKVAIDIFGTSLNVNKPDELNKLFHACLDSLPWAVNTLIQYSVEHGADAISDILPCLPQVPAHSNKVSRNAPCPCGSGKKFKKCCGGPSRSVH